MGEKELSRALLQLDGGLPVLPDVKDLTRRVLAADRRRVRWLSALAIFFWLAALGLVGVVFVQMGLLMPKQAKLHKDLKEGKIAPPESERVQLTNQVMGQMIVLHVAAAVAVLGLAALSTFLLVLASRRATLRQVSASLLEISDQLRELKVSIERATPPK